MANFSNQLKFGNIEKMVDKDVRLTISDMSFKELTNSGQVSQANSSFIISAPQKEDNSGDTGYYGLFIADYQGNITSILPFNKFNDNHFYVEYDNDELKFNIKYAYISNIAHNEFDNSIYDINNKLNNNTSYIDDLNHTAINHSSKLNSLENNLNNLQNTVNNNKQELEVKIDNLKEKLNTTYILTYGNSLNINSINTVLTGLSDTITYLQNQIAYLQAKTVNYESSINRLNNIKHYIPDNLWTKQGNSAGDMTYLLTINEDKLNNRIQQYVNTYENTYIRYRNNVSSISDIIGRYDYESYYNPISSYTYHVIGGEYVGPIRERTWEYTF